MELLVDKFKILILLALFTLVSWAYNYIPNSENFPAFASLYTLHFAFYALLLRYQGRSSIGLAFLVGVALINRILLLGSAPILENDYFRYLWDGRVLASGTNPYLYSPNATELDSLTVWYRALIGWPEIRTIYPPLAELFFGALHVVAPDSLMALKIGLMLVEVSAGLLLLWFIKDGANRKLIAILYFFNPLLLKEVSNSAHLDALPMLLSLAAVLCFMTYQNFKWLSWILLALAVGAKSYPVILVPLFIKLDPKWRKNLTLFGLTVIALYLPFVGAWEKLFSGASAFGTYWIFNAGLFKVITILLNSLIEGIAVDWATSEQGNFILVNDYPAKVVVGLMLVSFILYKARKINSPQELPRASLSLLGALLLLSPVVNAWYVLWLLPFACLEMSVPWLTFTYLVVAAYSWFWSESFAPGVRAVEYGVLFLLTLGEWRRSDDHQELRKVNVGVSNV